MGGCPKNEGRFISWYEIRRRTLCGLGTPRSIVAKKFGKYQVQNRAVWKPLDARLGAQRTGWSWWMARFSWDRDSSHEGFVVVLFEEISRFSELDLTKINTVRQSSYWGTSHLGSTSFDCGRGVTRNGAIRVSHRQWRLWVRGRALYLDGVRLVRIVWKQWLAEEPFGRWDPRIGNQNQCYSKTRSGWRAAGLQLVRWKRSRHRKRSWIGAWSISTTPKPPRGKWATP